MHDFYHVPVLILTLLLLPGFGHLYLRFRDTRTLLWFLGFFFALIRMLSYMPGPWGYSQAAQPWIAAAGQTSILVSSALFLASLSPMRFRVGRLNVLYVIPFTVPLIVFSILLEGVFHGKAPYGPMFLVFPALGLLSVVVGCIWGARDNSTPAWLGGGICAAAGALALWVYFTQGASPSLTAVECGAHFVTAVLLIFVYRRFSSGVFLTAAGFTAWSLGVLEFIPWISQNVAIDLILIRIIVMGKVIAALGMILLALEDELNINKTAQERERRARMELEAYTSLILSRRRVDDFDRQGPEICQTVVAQSRFAQAALLLQSSGRFRLAGTAGLDKATATALEELATRIPASGFLAPGSAPLAAEHSQTLSLDLTPWLIPGDDLQRLRFTRVLAVPMVGRTATEGALLLASLRPAGDNAPGHSKDSFRADDLLPIEMLTARLQATRSQTMMLEKLIDSEKFAGLGQLAGNVTQQLNNPLTVILGYASLLEETSTLDAQERRGVQSILTEARRMRTTLESLSRISRPYGDQYDAASVTELLADMEELHRPEFLHRSIDFRLSVAPALPKVQCSAQQLRQAVLHCLQFAIDAVDCQGPAKSEGEPKSIRLEATSEGNLVQILVAHSGAKFVNPDRAFDPFVQSQTTGETASLGLSLCATILRENNGRASAVNFEPRGAAILLELQAA